MKKIKEKNKKEAHPSKPFGLMETQLAAYHLWLKRGSPVGDDLVDWLKAEQRNEGVIEEEWEEE